MRGGRNVLCDVVSPRKEPVVRDRSLIIRTILRQSSAVLHVLSSRES